MKLLGIGLVLAAATTVGTYSLTGLCPLGCLHKGAQSVVAWFVDGGHCGRTGAPTACIAGGGGQCGGGGGGGVANVVEGGTGAGCGSGGAIVHVEDPGGSGVHAHAHVGGSGIGCGDTHTKTTAIEPANAELVVGVGSK